LDEEDRSYVDPNFFDPGYSMAGTTGFKVSPPPLRYMAFRFFAVAPIQVAGKIPGRRDLPFQIMGENEIMQI
jgi:hypothetical protein